MSRKKKSVRYSKSVINFIADKIAGGKSLAQVCREFPEQTPEEKQVHKWKLKHEYARVTIDTAYQTLLISYVDKLIDLAHTPLPDCDSREELLKAEKERRLQQDSLKFLAAKITPKLVPQYSDKVKVEHEGSTGPQFILVDYSRPDDSSKDVTLAIEDVVDSEVPQLGGRLHISGQDETNE